MPDSVIDFIASEAKRVPGIRKIILFGSRARGDHHSKSDYDIAVETTGIDHSSWSEWSTNLREKAPTLCGVDLVWLSELKDAKLRDVIAKEGRVIYG